MIFRLLLAGLATVASAAALRSRVISSNAAAYARSTSKRALLISNSKLAGLDYLVHVKEHIRSFLGDCEGGFVLFVPYAQRDRDGYAAKVRSSLGEYDVRSLADYDSREARLDAVREASCVFVGGGNTFRLLKCLQQDEGLLTTIKSRVSSGELKYIGSSAGSNLACPTIRNTNDMPIVWPERGLDGLGLVPFQINTHYIDEERELKNHMGETRAKRLEEFHEENDVPVLALREGSTVLVEGEHATLLGPTTRSAQVTWEGARLLRPPKDGGPREVGVGESLDFLMRLGDEGAPPPATLFDVSPLLSDEGQQVRRAGAKGDGFKSG